MQQVIYHNYSSCIMLTWRPCIIRFDFRWLVCDSSYLFILRNFWCRCTIGLILVFYSILHMALYIHSSCDKLHHGHLMFVHHFVLYLVIYLNLQITFHIYSSGDKLLHDNLIRHFICFSSDNLFSSAGDSSLFIVRPVAPRWLNTYALFTQFLMTHLNLQMILLHLHLFTMSIPMRNRFK